jgi:predicted transposase/invertase (TIGR01784 family)
MPIAGLPDEEYSRLSIVDPYLRRLFKKDKQGILDVKVLTKSGKVINVEVQVCRFAAIRKRILYYLARLIGEQLRRGDKYDRIQQTIIVIICDHLIPGEPGQAEDPDFPSGMISEDTGLGGKDRYINSFSMRNDADGETFTNLIKIITIELPKVPRKTDRNAAWPWARFFTCEDEEEYDMLAKENPEVTKVVGTLKRLSWGERRRMIAEQEEMWRKDRAAMDDDARQEGREKGRKEGREEGRQEGRQEGREEGRKEEREKAFREKLEAARKMKDDGFTAEQIQKYTGLSPEEMKGR